MTPPGIPIRTIFRSLEFRYYINRCLNIARVSRRELSLRLKSNQHRFEGSRGSNRYRASSVQVLVDRLPGHRVPRPRCKNSKRDCPRLVRRANMALCHVQKFVCRSVKNKRGRKSMDSSVEMVRDIRSCTLGWRHTVVGNAVSISPWGNSGAFYFLSTWKKMQPSIDPCRITSVV